MRLLIKFFISIGLVLSISYSYSNQNNPYALHNLLPEINICIFFYQGSYESICRIEQNIYVVGSGVFLEEHPGHISPWGSSKKYSKKDMFHLLGRQMVSGFTMVKENMDKPNEILFQFSGGSSQALLQEMNQFAKEYDGTVFSFSNNPESSIPESSHKRSIAQAIAFIFNLITCYLTPGCTMSDDE